MSKTTISPGDRVKILPPHPEAGAVGEVTNVYHATGDMDRRARVRFQTGAQTVAVAMLARTTEPLNA